MNKLSVIRQSDAATTTQEMLEHAEWYLHGGHTHESEMYCQQILHIERNNADAHNLLGLIALQTGRTEAAQNHFLIAITHAPDRALFHRNLGATCYVLGEDDAAEEHFRTAVELNADDSGSLLNLGLLLKFSGRTAEASPLLEQAMLRRKTDPLAMSQLTDPHMSLQQGRMEGINRGATLG